MARKKGYRPPRYLRFRDGRPRWVPGPALRRLGFKGVDLKDPSGNWLSEGDAIMRALELNDLADAKRRDAPPPKRGIPKLPNTCEELWEHFRHSPRFDRLRPKTKQDYRNKAKVFLKDFGPVAAAALDIGIVEAWWQRMVETRGHAMANGTLAVARVLLEHGRRLGWIALNPASRLGIPGVAPRVVTWTPAEIVLMVRTADAAGLSSVADAFVFGLHTGQRQTDVLAYGDDVALNGRVLVKQSKRGAIVAVKLTTVAENRAIGALERKRKAKIASPRLLIDERTGTPYTSDRFQKRFAYVRLLAAVELIMQGDEAGAWAILHKHYQDLRDTYLTRSHAAGNDAKKRAAVSGHSERTQVQNEAHYIAVGAELADQAQDALEAWLAEQGIAI